MHQALLAEDVLAGEKGVLGDGEVEVERDGDVDCVDIFAGQQFAIVLIRRHLAAERFQALFETDVPVVAEGDAAPDIAGFVQMFDEVAAAATGTDETVLELIVGGTDFLNKRGARHRGGGGSHGAGCFYEIAAGDIVVLGHNSADLK